MAVLRPQVSGSVFLHSEELFLAATQYEDERGSAGRHLREHLARLLRRAHGLPVDARADTPGQVAAIVRARRALGLEGGELVTVPVPVADELPRAEAEAAIAQATRLAEEAGITGVGYALASPGRGVGIASRWSWYRKP